MFIDLFVWKSGAKEHEIERERSRQWEQKGGERRRGGVNGCRKEKKEGGKWEGREGEGSRDEER